MGAVFVDDGKSLLFFLCSLGSSSLAGESIDTSTIVPTGDTTMIITTVCHEASGTSDTTCMGPKLLVGTSSMEGGNA